MPTFSARAPGRVELLGNHTDYNQGVVLSAAINRFVTVEGDPSGDLSITVSSSSLPEPVQASLDALTPFEDARAWANYVLGVAYVLREQGHALGGFRLHIDSDLPAGAGLSSSAALEVATACFLTKAFGLNIPKLELARICRRAENEFVGVKCGLLDQASSLFGKDNQAIYLDCRSEEIENVPLPAGTALLVFHCGIGHRLTGGEYNDRRAHCFSAAHALGVDALRDVTSAFLAAVPVRLDARDHECALHIVGENERVLTGIKYLRRGDGRRFGELMFESHESSRVNFLNSTPELDVLVELAREEEGVYGSRLTGGGFGGATISLVDEARAEQIAQRLHDRYKERTGNEGRAHLCLSVEGAH